MESNALPLPKHFWLETSLFFALFSLVYYQMEVNRDYYYQEILPQVYVILMYHVVGCRKRSSLQYPTNRNAVLLFDSRYAKWLKQKRVMSKL